MVMPVRIGRLDQIKFPFAVPALEALLDEQTMRETSGRVFLIFVRPAKRAQSSAGGIGSMT